MRSKEFWNHRFGSHFFRLLFAALPFVVTISFIEVLASGKEETALGADSSNSGSWSEMDNPNEDGWKSEVFSEQVGVQLKKIGALLVQSGELPGARLGEIADEDFSLGVVCVDLMPVFEKGPLCVERCAGDHEKSHPEIPSPRGSTGLARALARIGRPFEPSTDRRFKFKVFDVVMENDEATTRQLFQRSAKIGSGAVEESSTWICRWKLDGVAPTLLSLDVIGLERVTTGEVLFTECTESMLGQNSSYRDQLTFGLNHWLGSIENTGVNAFLGTPGIALGDVNGDGRDDLYVCQEHGLPNLLFVQDDDGTLRDVSQKSGVDFIHSSRSALLIDLDNDSDQDLVVAMSDAVVVADNDGEGVFSVRSTLGLKGGPMSMNAVDYDVDGDLDLYVCTYDPERTLRRRSSSAFASDSRRFVLHDANNGGSNALFRNDGGWSFTDTTVASGLDTNNRRFSFASAWEDFDDDGDLDLYVANDYGRDNLYVNRGSDAKLRFSDEAKTARVESSAGGMSVVWGDYDRDGHMDAYVSNMYSSAGQRVTGQEEFKPGSSEETRDRLRRFARGNTLLMNDGNRSFSDQSASAGVEMGRWAWGSVTFDLNNDGWEDLFVSNGYITTDDTGDL